MVNYYNEEESLVAKLRIGVLFGGKSTEHEVSLVSAKNIMRAMDTARYDVVPIGIDHQGRWFFVEQKLLAQLSKPGVGLSRLPAANQLAVVPGDGECPLLEMATGRKLERLDAVFPVVHGIFGEDGTLQGLLQLLNLPFVGAGVLGSAVGMDKDLMKRLLRAAGVPVTDFLIFDQIAQADFARVEKQLGLPVFVKPCNGGSSVGISRASTALEFSAAVKTAFAYDEKDYRGSGCGGPGNRMFGAGERKSRGFAARRGHSPGRVLFLRK